MTNTDFWTSIQQIIDEDFTSKGLETLDLYAEQFVTRRLIYQRFSSQEHYGCTQGGTVHVIASLLAGADVTANQLTAPVGSF